ncbi:MAG: hypothetical protein RMN51_01485 [Verrucomicrobiota bacterium]|nr:hypothetical protein [Limisphaera sp.]MDW8380771.1 hypothetical protein [Verrucomicrobiota bacterium]
MLRQAKHVTWDDSIEAVPAFLVILGIPVAFSIADGLALGLITYPLVKVLAGRGREVILQRAGRFRPGVYYLLARARGLIPQQTDGSTVSDRKTQS